jgi:hypothetical protein
MISLNLFFFRKSSSFPASPMSVKVICFVDCVVFHCWLFYFIVDSLTLFCFQDFNSQFQCRVRRINRLGEFLHLGSGSVRDGNAQVEPTDVCIAEVTRWGLLV